jgi:ELWxxDGT repeat protein
MVIPVLLLGFAVVIIGFTAGGVGSVMTLIPFSVPVYFPGCNDTTGYELWKTDNTAAGTIMVKAYTPVPATARLPSTSVNWTGPVTSGPGMVRTVLSCGRQTGLRTARFL